MTQQIEQELWEEFEKESERIKDFDVSKLNLSPENNSILDSFFKKFLDPKEIFPEGQRHSTIEKNLAIWIVKNKIPLEQIQEGYKAKGFNISSLQSQVKGVLNGTYGEAPHISVGELVNWCKKFRPDLVQLFVTEVKASTDDERLKSVGIGNVLKFLDMDELKNYQEKEGGEIVQRLIPGGSIGAWGGKRASYKSWMGLSCALCISNGLEFCGFKTEKCAVGYLDRENGYSELKKRVLMLEKGLEIENSGEIYFLADYFKVDETDHLLQIENFIMKRKIKIIFIDVYRRAVSFDENDANRVSEFFVDRIKPLCERTGVSVIFLHHEKKGDSPDEMDNLRGSSDLVNYLDFVLLNVRRGNKVILKQLKSRRSIEIQPIDIQIETDEKSFMRFKSLGVSSSTTEPERCAKEILKFLIKSGAKEITFTDFMRRAQEFNYPESTAKLSLNSLQSRGLLEKGKSKRSPYILNVKGLNLEDYFT
jgi:hypothetical protein